MNHVATDGRDVAVTVGGQDWLVAWHPPPDAPPGTPHGAAAICVHDGQVVLVSADGQRWGPPGGRPERGETWAETLAREVREEACARVTSTRLVGFTRGTCVRGHEEGLVLVRSMWRAEVRLLPWEPSFEMSHRRLVPADGALGEMTIEGGTEPIYRRMFREAAVGSGGDVSSSRR